MCVRVRSFICLFVWSVSVNLYVRAQDDFFIEVTSHAVAETRQRRMVSALLLCSRLFFILQLIMILDFRLIELSSVLSVIILFRFRSAQITAL